jgi:hypothetical protein
MSAHREAGIDTIIMEHYLEPRLSPCSSPELATRTPSTKYDKQDKQDKIRNEGPGNMHPSNFKDLLQGGSRTTSNTPNKARNEASYCENASNSTTLLQPGEDRLPGLLHHSSYSQAETQSLAMVPTSSSEVNTPVGTMTSLTMDDLKLETEGRKENIMRDTDMDEDKCKTMGEEITRSFQDGNVFSSNEMEPDWTRNGPTEYEVIDQDEDDLPFLPPSFNQLLVSAPKCPEKEMVPVTTLFDLPTEIHEGILDCLFGVRSSASSQSQDSRALRGWSTALRHPRRRELANLALVHGIWRHLIQERLYRHSKYLRKLDGIGANI